MVFKSYIGVKPIRAADFLYKSSGKVILLDL